MNPRPAQPPTCDRPAASEIWQMVLHQLRLQTDSRTFSSYIRETHLVQIDGDTAQIAAPGAHQRDWLASRMTRTIERQLAPLVGRPVMVQFLVAGQPEEAGPRMTGSRAGVGGPAGGGTPSGGAPTGGPTASDIPGHAHRVGGIPSGGLTAGDFANDSQSSHHTADNRSQASGATAGDRPSFDTASGGRPMGGWPTGGSATTEALTPEDGEDDPLDQPIWLSARADRIETALTQPGKVIAFPRYELRHIPLVGPEAFFLRLAFLQERYFHTPPEARARPFETSVEALLRWAHVGRATLHRFKKGDPSRNQPPAAAWFGIQQLPALPRSSSAPQQPPCRYQVQQGIPLTPADAEDLYQCLIEAGIQQDPLGALQAVCARPLNQILAFPPPARHQPQRFPQPEFLSPARVVQEALGRRAILPEQRPQFQALVAQLSDHITLPHQMVFVSWYFMQHWLPILGHDAAALVLYSRAQGYYNPQTQELRDTFAVPGGYRELAGVIGLKRDRTIADWLPNLFERQPRPGPSEGETEKWQREQRRQQQVQAHIGQFLQVQAGSRKKMPEGHYAFRLQVEIQGEPLTPADAALRGWCQRVLAASEEAQVLPHLVAWATSAAVGRRAAAQNDGAGTLGVDDRSPAPAGPEPQNDVWGILAAQTEQAKTTARESSGPDADGWGILGGLLNDVWGMLPPGEMTAGELFKGLLRLNPFWDSVLPEKTTPAPAASQPDSGGGVVGSWNLRALCRQNGGLNRFREAILAQETSPQPFLSWLLYAYSFKGRGIQDPIGWALARLQEQPGALAGPPFARLAAQPPERVASLLNQHIQSGRPPHQEDWSFAFRDTPPARLRELALVLGLGQPPG